MVDDSGYGGHGRPGRPRGRGAHGGHNRLGGRGGVMVLVDILDVVNHGRDQGRVWGCGTVYCGHIASYNTSFF